MQKAANIPYLVAKNEKSAELEALADAERKVTVRGLLFKKSPNQKKQTLPLSLSMTILEIQKKE